MKISLRRFDTWLTLAVALVTASCGGNDLTLPSDSVVAKITLVSGDKQTAVVGGTLPDNLVIQLTDAKGRPVQNEQVTFTPGDANSGATTPPNATSDAQGKVSVSWVLGAVAGQQSMIAKPTGTGAPANLSVTFTATATVSAASKLVKVSGDQQTATAGTAVAVPPAVKVTDANGNAIVGMSVTFAVASGGGSIAPTTPIPTNANGVATLTSWTLGASAGPNSVRASIAGSGITGNPATFTATGVVGSSNKLVFITNPSTTTVGAVVSPAVRVQVQDASGNPIGGATNSVTLVLGNNPTGAALGGTTTVAAAGGVATFSTLTINKAGTGYTLSAFASGLVSVESQPFDVSAATPTQIVANSAQSQSAGAGSTVPAPPSVIVKDAGGNGVPNVNVTFTVASGGGSTVPASPATIATNASGVATLTSWTLGSSPGANQVTATAASVSGSVVFDATGTAGFTISTSSPLPNGEVGVSYAGGNLSASGTFTPPVQWSKQSGALPGGLSLGTLSGAITGTPNSGAAGTASFTVKATDALGATATKDFQLTIVPAIHISTTSLPGGTVGAAYGQTVATSGGQGTLTFSQQGGGQPAPGLTLNTSSGAITGTPTTPGPYNFTIVVTDQLGGTDNQALSIVVSSASTTTALVPNTPSSVWGEAVTFTANVTSSGGTPTGSVTFKDGTCASGTTLETHALSSGSATTNPISSLEVGSHDIHACYTGTGAFAGATSEGNGTQTVAKASTSTTINSNTPNPSTAGGAVTVTVTVAASAPGAGTPTGTVNVTVSSSATDACTVTLSNGTGSCNLTITNAGAGQTITATYQDDSHFNGGSTATASQDVN